MPRLRHDGEMSRFSNLIRRFRTELSHPKALIFDPERHATLLNFYWSFGAWAVICAFFSAPLLRYGNPGALLLLAAGLGGMVSTVHVSLLAVRATGVILTAPFFLCFTMIAFVGGRDLPHDVATSLKANDRRCLAIQRDMLSSMPLRSDDPDLFQALGCRPQGDGSVYAQRDTKDDTDAAAEQSARRRALPYRSPYQSGSHGAVLK